MSSESKAVFLSYASQDADAARKICDALRAAQVEVWFDQSELVGGDAWDAKIRKQIAECALFVPVISANTQARGEGYFRLEWHLAEQRTFLMAHDQPFLVPVVIDDTEDAAARVPERFRDRQWTRLPGGRTEEAFYVRVRELLEGSAAGAQRARSIQGAPIRPEARVSKAGSRSRLALATLVGLAALLALAIWQPWRKEKVDGLNPPAAAVPAPAPPALEGKSIAVLPFKNQSLDASNAFFTDGVHEDILTSLFNIRDLHVVSRTSVEQYRDTKKPIKQIGEELRVAYVLEGSVQREGNKVRVTGTLIDARTDRQAWSKNYHKELSDIFAIQAELAKAIANELHAIISPQVAKLLDTKPTENPLAYDKYLEARALKNRRGGVRGVNDESLALLNEAVVLDPKFGLGWAWQAFHYGQEYLGNSSPASLAKATAAIDAALRLAPDEPEVVLNRGYYYYHRRDFDRATEYLEQFARLRPNTALKHYALSAPQRRQGKWPEAMANLRRATQLEPGNIDYSQLLADLLLAGRRYEEAMVEYTRLAAMHDDPLGIEFILARTHFLMRGSPERMEAFFQRLTSEQVESSMMKTNRRSWELMMGRAESAPAGSAESSLIFAAKGELAEVRARSERSIAGLRRRIDERPEDSNGWGLLARREALAGNKEEALRCALRATELIPESRDRVAGSRLRADLAFVYTWTGDKEKAIAEYAHLLREPVQQSMLVENVHVMKTHPQFAPLRGHPGFEALLKDPKNNAPLF